LPWCGRQWRIGDPLRLDEASGRTDLGLSVLDSWELPFCMGVLVVGWLCLLSVDTSQESVIALSGTIGTMITFSNLKEDWHSPLSKT
jgi:hypothetical protein